MQRTVLKLNAVTITENVQNSWLRNLKAAILLLQKEYPNLTEQDVPDEQFAIDEKGAEIFVQVRDTKVRMQVPEGEYRILN